MPKVEFPELRLEYPGVVRFGLSVGNTLCSGPSSLLSLEMGVECTCLFRAVESEFDTSKALTLQAP
jgi:hypothetical protein